MSKKKRKKPVPDTQEDTAAKKAAQGNILRLLILVAVVAVVFCVYRFLIERFEEYTPVILIVYMSLATATTLAYVIYNRGFSRKGLTTEMLPDTMSLEEKTEFIEDGERRLRRSRPLLMVVLAFAFTFVAELVELVAIPFLMGVVGK